MVESIKEHSRPMGERRKEGFASLEIVPPFRPTILMRVGITTHTTLNQRSAGAVGRNLTSGFP